MHNRYKNEKIMDKSVEKTVTLFRKSYAGRLTADERAEMVRLLEDENMRKVKYSFKEKYCKWD